MNKKRKKKMNKVCVKHGEKVKKSILNEIERKLEGQGLIKFINYITGYMEKELYTGVICYKYINDKIENEKKELFNIANSTFKDFKNINHRIRTIDLNKPFTLGDTTLTFYTVTRFLFSDINYEWYFKYYLTNRGYYCGIIKDENKIILKILIL